ncbi:unnamed protein product [Blepharisma stoltei]|uniref:EF-hand domain-containing protein n=1 Tax=Blepharisma stoltei TaxID=1481888 RepID=A0AAU9JD80_9CILI|nr:unnamed protein product [Blepharisma stoltei]
MAEKIFDEQNLDKELLFTLESIEIDNDGKLDYKDLKSTTIEFYKKFDLPPISDKEFDDAITKIDPFKTKNIDLKKYKEIIRRKIMHTIEN